MYVNQSALALTRPFKSKKVARNDCKRNKSFNSSHEGTPKKLQSHNKIQATLKINGKQINLDEYLETSSPLARIQKKMSPPTLRNKVLGFRNFKNIQQYTKRMLTPQERPKSTLGFLTITNCSFPEKSIYQKHSLSYKLLDKLKDQKGKVTFSISKSNKLTENVKNIRAKNCFSDGRKRQCKGVQVELIEFQRKYKTKKSKQNSNQKRNSFFCFEEENGLSGWATQKDLFDIGPQFDKSNGDNPNRLKCSKNLFRPIHSKK